MRTILADMDPTIISYDYDCALGQAVNEGLDPEDHYTHAIAVRDDSCVRDQEFLDEASGASNHNHLCPAYVREMLWSELDAGPLDSSTGDILWFDSERAWMIVDCWLPPG